MTHKKILLFLLAVILLSGSILAFAVSSQYYENNPMYLQQGESQDIKLMLQNHAGTEDVNVKVEIKDGKGIIELKEPSDTFVIPKGDKIDINLKVSAPSNSKKGDIFPVTIMFTSLTANEGPIGLSGSIGKGFNLIVGEASDFDENGNLKINLSWLVYTMVATVIAAVGAAVFYFVKKKSSSKKRANKF